VTAGIVIGAGVAQQLVKVIGDRVTAIVGMVVAASGLLLLSSASVDASYASDILPGLIPQSVAWGSRSCRSR
jgi:fucose permease